MVSSLFKKDYKAMVSQGVTFTLEDIIRLNALAVKVKLARNATGPAHLARVVFLGKKLVLREPEIGHEIWLERASAFIDLASGRNFDFVHAFALSRDWRELPNVMKPKRVVRNVFAFARKYLLSFTPQQLGDAVLYALWGADWTIGEMPPSASEDGAANGDVRESSAVGVMMNALAYRIGLSLDDAKRMTASQILEVIARARCVSKEFERDYEFNRAMADYVRARNEISRNSGKPCRE